MFNFSPNQQQSNRRPARSIGFHLRAGELQRVSGSFLFYFCFEQSRGGPKAGLDWSFLGNFISGPICISPFVLNALRPCSIHLVRLQESWMDLQKVQWHGLSCLRLNFSAKLLTSLTSLKTLAVIFQNRIKMNILSLFWVIIKLHRSYSKTFIVWIQRPVD